MPTYEYACKDCGKHLEVVQSFKDDALTECPNCHGSLRKVFSAAGIIFKGSGWHVKDYASSGSRPATAAGGSDGESSGSESTKDSGSSESSGSDTKATSGSESKKSASGSSDTTSGTKATSTTATAEKKSA